MPRPEADFESVPPPWAVFDEHPCSLCWRMGGGEGHLMLWWDWWPKQGFSEDQRVAYFRRWPPPHCWLEFVISAIWNVDLGTDADLALYFARTEALGFGGRADFDRDFNDPAWLNR